MSDDGNKKGYFTFCDVEMMTVAKKAYVIEFLEDKKNGKIFKELELLAYELYESLSRFDDTYDLERLAEALSFMLKKTRHDSLKESFVQHCLDKRSGCKVSEGLEAVARVLVGMVKDSERFRKDLR